MNIFYAYIFVITLALAGLFTFLVQKIAWYFRIVDRPDQERKRHKGEIPFLGGLAIFLAFFIVLFDKKPILIYCLRTCFFEK